MDLKKKLKRPLEMPSMKIPWPSQHEGGRNLESEFLKGESYIKPFNLTLLISFK